MSTPAISSGNVHSCNFSSPGHWAHRWIYHRLCETVTNGRRGTRPSVTFPNAQHCNCTLAGTISRSTDGRMLSWPMRYAADLLNGVDDCWLRVNVETSDVVNELFTIIALHGTSEHQQQDPLQLRITRFCIQHTTATTHPVRTVTITTGFTAIKTGCSFLCLFCVIASSVLVYFCCARFGSQQECTERTVPGPTYIIFWKVRICKRTLYKII